MRTDSVSLPRAFIGLCLIGLLALLGAGCGRAPSSRSTAASDKGPTADSSAQPALTFWHIMNYSGPMEVLAAAVARFESDHPGVHVAIQTFDNDAYKTKLAVEMASGTPPDVFFTWGGGTLAEFAAAGRVTDLSDVLEKDGWGDRFIDQAMQICSSNGRAFAVPLDLSLVLLWYNRDLFTRYGLAPPADLDQLLDAAARLRENGIVPLSLGNMKQWPGAFYFIYLATRIGGTPLFLDAAAGRSGATFDDPAFVEAGRQIRRLIENNVFPTGFNGLDVGPARTRFLQEQAAMYLMGTWLVARVKTEMPEFLDKLACVPFPVVKDGHGDPSTVVGGVNCGFAVSSTSPNRELAVELLRYLTSDTVAAEWCGIGRIPALKVAPDVEEKLPLPTRNALAILKSADCLQPYYDQYLRPRLASEHKKTTQKLFAGTITPEEAAAQMAKVAREQE